jgi:hypothetical protein
MNVLKALSKLPSSEIQRLLKASRWVAVREDLRRQVESLRSKLTKAERKLTAVDRRINGNGTARLVRRPKKGGSRGGRGGGPALKDIVHGILKKLGRAADCAEIAPLAIKAGYKTKSDKATFKRAVHQALRTDPRFTKEARGLFKVK